MGGSFSFFQSENIVNLAKEQYSYLQFAGGNYTMFASHLTCFYIFRIFFG